MSRLRALLIFGTRPEAIKMAPVVRACRARSEEVETAVCLTGQHGELLREAIEYFGIRPDVQLDLMRADQSLGSLTARCAQRLDDVLLRLKPDCVVVQGDTTTVMAASLCAFYRRVPLVHVEAGLRTGDLRAPWPEELNRRIADMVAALNLALDDALRTDEAVVLLGQDIGLDEGVFRVTANLLNKYGDRRVLDTPLAEAAIVGGAVGMALYGLKPVAEMQFSGFAYQAFHQIEQHVSRFRNRTRGRFSLPMVVRMPYGGGIRAIEHHSESREAYYAHTPGLYMVIPSTPRNARALLLASIRHPDPVIFFEPKAVYRAFKEEVPDEPETIPLGKARVVREGRDITFFSYGAMMRPTLEAADDLAEQDGVSAEIVDLLTVSPLDTATIAQSAGRTGRVVVIHEGPRTCGIGAEVVARIVEKSLMHLEAPIRRVTGFDVQFPYFARERAFLPNADRIVHAAREVLAF